MLAFHETETCEGIIQHLEQRQRDRRSDVQIRDRGSETSADARVEMTFRLGAQLYALEHTGIEPFDGFMAHQNRASSLFLPLQAAAAASLSAILADGVVIEMHLPIDAFMDRKMPEVRAIQTALLAWIAATAPTLPPRRYADYRGALVTAQPTGVPFQVSLVRFDGIAGMEGRFQLKHLTRGAETPRVERIARACEKKFPKLARWKQSEAARTVLVFEDNDVQLTNVSIVAEALPSDRHRPRRRARRDLHGLDLHVALVRLAGLGRRSELFRPRGDQPSHSFRDGRQRPSPHTSTLTAIPCPKPTLLTTAVCRYRESFNRRSTHSRTGGTSRSAPNKTAVQ